MIHRYSFSASARSPVSPASNNRPHSRGNTFDNPDTHPTAPSARHSSTTSSSPQNSANRSPTTRYRSTKRRVSPELSLIATIVSIAARDFASSGVMSFR